MSVNGPCVVAPKYGVCWYKIQSRKRLNSSCIKLYANIVKALSHCV